MNSQEQDVNKKETQSERSGFTKFLIIVLLLSVLFGAAWGAIKIVKNFPEAINSLASIADTVYNYNPKEQSVLTINTDRNVINAGETVSIWWSEVDQDNDYSFNYACQDGVAVDLQENENDEFISIACDTEHKLSNDGHIKIKVESEKDRFSDISFIITNQTKDGNISTKDDSKLTVINTSISDPIATNDETEGSNGETEGSTAPDNEQVEDSTDEDDHNETNTNEEPKQKPVVTPQTYYTYKIPVSDPNGRTDLLLSNLKTGYINDIGIFIESNNAVSGLKNALQFTVHNIGTKTSEDWTLKINSSNSLLLSEEQKSLKPNERSTLIVQLPGLEDYNYANISVLIETDDDANINNNYSRFVVN